MSNLERKVDALLQLVSAETADGRDAAMRVIRGLVTLQPSAAKDKEDLEDAIRDALFRIGVPDSLLGHRYLVSAVSIAAKEPERTCSIAKNLYPEIARQYNTTETRVERAIRHAIEVGCDRGDYDEIVRYFGNTMNAAKGKPTNREFIARVAYVIRKELEA